MPSRLSAAEMLDREFLQIRCRLVEIAAALDRIDASRGSEELAHERTLLQVQEATRLLGNRSTDRTRRVQMLFSLPHDEDWRR
jgi:hypothetical protein